METNINETLREIKDLIEHADAQNLLISVHAIAYSYEHGNLEESDIYNLMRDSLSVITSIEALKGII